MTDALPDDLPDHLRLLIQEFADLNGHGEWFRVPHVARNQCEFASVLFGRMAYAHGLDPVVLHLTDEEADESHCVTEVDGWIIDWTATQFEASYPVPLVYQGVDQHRWPECERLWDAKRIMGPEGEGFQIMLPDEPPPAPRRGR